MESFTQFSRKLLNLAAQEASSLGHIIVDSEHMIIAISRQSSSLAAKILYNSGLETDTIIEKVLEKNEKGNVPSNILSYSEDIKSVFEDSISVARSLDFDFVGVEHVLIAILSKENIATSILNEQGIYEDTVTKEVISAKDNFENMRKKLQNTLFDDEIGDSDRRNIYVKSPRLGSFLDRFSVDLTNKAENDELNLIRNRDTEIKRIIQILSRKNKNNPLLVGDSGVGKTSIVHAIAQNIASGNVPDILKEKRIISLNVPSVISGVRYKGEIEERIKGIIEEARKNKNIILFIDNFHSISIIANQESTIEAGNIFKNALEESYIQIIGCTGKYEYKRYVEKDDSMKRRVQSIFIEEPSEDIAIKMIMDIKSNYEDFHSVKISEEMVELSVRLANRYISERYLPDKAIDVIDEASAKLKLERTKEYYEIEGIIKNITDCRKKLEDDVKYNNINNAYILKDEVNNIDEILSSISDENLKLYNQQKNLTKEYIENVVSDISGVPTEKLSKSDEEKLLDMEKNLSKNVIGQQSAVNAVTRAVQRSKVGLNNPKKPIGSFIFVGPTGVGKTKLAKMLAKELFDDEEAVIKVDMSEYMGKFDVTKIIGSPPGYVGYNEGGQLTEKIKNKPYSVVLFDEIEKAHSDVFDLLLQVLDEGNLTDSQGKKISFKNTIIIMTSNAGATDINKSKNLGFGSASYEKTELEQERNYLSEIKKSFKPEFLNRVDEIIVFKQLKKEDIKNITSLLIEEVADKLKSRNIELTLYDTALEFIASQGYSNEYGARELGRVIQRLVEDKLTQKILKSEISDGKKVKIYEKNAKLVFKVN